jgi:tight adherence protein B
MRLLAGLCAGLFVYLSLGAIVGITPRLLEGSTSSRHGRSQRTSEWLRRAGVDVTPSQFVAVSVGLAALVSLVVHVMTGVVPLALVTGGLALWLPRSFYGRRRAELERERINAWPDALRDLIAHLRSSVSVHAALVELGSSGPPALRPHFNRYAGLAATLGQRTSLQIIREELADPVSDRVIEIILVAFEQGPGVVIDVLGDLATATAGDLALSDDIRTAQLEIKIEARGAAIMPFAVLFLLIATSNDYATFYRSSAGWLVIGLGGLLCMGGLVTINRLGRLPIEHRILTSGSQR